MNSFHIDKYSIWSLHSTPPMYFNSWWISHGWVIRWLLSPSAFIRQCRTGLPVVSFTILHSVPGWSLYNTDLMQWLPILCLGPYSQETLTHMALYHLSLLCHLLTCAFIPSPPKFWGFLNIPYSLTRLQHHTCFSFSQKTLPISWSWVNPLLICDSA